MVAFKVAPAEVTTDRQLVEQILKNSNGTVVVLLLSTYEEQEYAPHAAECGAATYISKSKFEPDRLAAAWERAKKR